MRKREVLRHSIPANVVLATLCAFVLGAGIAYGAQGVHDVTEYGAVSGGKTLCTKAIQKAVDACAKAGGGKVVVPPGTYLTGPIFLKSNVHLEVMAGATLLGSTDLEDYPAVPGRWEGIDRTIYASLITGHDLENISITGRGTLDGQGEMWWEAHEATKAIRREHGITEREPENPAGTPLKWPRARMINLYRCKNILIRDITIRRSPSWTIHPVYCEDLTVDNVTIIQSYESPNTDGINPDSCKNVRISNCYIDVGDDCITIKSGYNADGRRAGVPCENIAITNCTFVHGHGGVVIGSEMSGDVRNITVSNCIFDGTQRGIRVKTARGRGGVVENFRATNLVMRNITEAAFSVTMGYSGGSVEGLAPVTEETPRLRNFHWSNITITGAGLVADIVGLPEMPVENLRLSNIYVVSAKAGIRCATAKGVTFDNIVVNADKGPAISVKNTQDLEIYRCTTEEPKSGTPVIQLEGVTDALIQNCKAVEGTGTFVALKGGANKNIEMRLNRLSNADKETEVVP